jgi:hypothetical protein
MHLTIVLLPRLNEFPAQTQWLASHGRPVCRLFTRHSIILLQYSLRSHPAV